MRSTRLVALALVSALTVAASGAGRADTGAAPFGPPVPVKHDVPRQVSAAIGVLRKACATWRSPALTPSPMVAGIVPKPTPATPEPLERTVCEVADNPNRIYVQTAVLGGIAGAILFFFGLLLFSAVRGTLISVWNWRLPIGAKSW